MPNLSQARDNFYSYLVYKKDIYKNGEYILKFVHCRFKKNIIKNTFSVFKIYPQQ
jgi:hypothetical protein